MVIFADVQAPIYLSQVDYAGNVHLVVYVRS